MNQKKKKKDEESKAVDPIGVLPSLSMGPPSSHLPCTPNPKYKPIPGSRGILLL